MWYHQTPYCIIIVYITLSPCSLFFPFRSTHLHLFSPPNRPTRSHMPSLITYYDIPFPPYLNALWIDQQRSKLKLAVLQVLLACCQQLDGRLLNDNNVYPLPSFFFIFFIFFIFIFFFFLSTLSRPLTHLAHAQVMRSGSARGGRKHLDHTQEGLPLRWIACTAPDPHIQQGLAAVAHQKGTNERMGEEGVHEKNRARERE